jgi:glutathione S-transferase
MSEEIVIHGVPGSPCVRSALLGLEEKGIPYRLAPVQIGAAGGLRGNPEHLKLHPFGRVPIMDHGDFRLYETQAILRYIDTLGGAMAPSLQPRDARSAARMNQVVGIVDWYVFPTISVGITAERLMSQRFWNRPADEANIAKALPGARVCINELARLKGAAPFMAGDSVTIADLMLAPHLDFFGACAEGSELLTGSPMEGWLTRMSSRASMQATQAERLRKSA